MAFDPWGGTREIISNVDDYTEAKDISSNEAVIIIKELVTKR